MKNHADLLVMICEKSRWFQFQCAEISACEYFVCLFPALHDVVRVYVDSKDKTTQKTHSFYYNVCLFNFVSVKTPVGQTDRVNVQKIVTQGGTFGPIECSNSIDKIGKLCHEKGEHLFTYKNLVNIMPLSMVDDLLAISEIPHTRQKW